MPSSQNDAQKRSLLSTRSLKVRQNVRKTTCNFVCNITAKRVKKRCCTFYHPHSTCPATNHLVAGSTFFCNKICTCCAFYRPKANLFCSKWPKSRAWRGSRVILFIQSEVSIHSTCSNLYLRRERFERGW